MPYQRAQKIRYHKVITDIAPSGLGLARLTGFEPATSRVGVLHSIQLSYRRIYGAEIRSFLF